MWWFDERIQRMSKLLKHAKVVVVGVNKSLQVLSNCDQSTVNRTLTTPSVA